MKRTLESEGNGLLELLELFSEREIPRYRGCGRAGHGGRYSLFMGCCQGVLSRALVNNCRWLRGLNSGACGSPSGVERDCGVLLVGLSTAQQLGSSAVSAAAPSQC